MVRSDRSIGMAAKHAALKEFGARLQEQRSATSLTQEEVADRLTVSTQTVRNWEAGRTEPSRSDKERLASVYNKPVEWFFREEEAQEPMNPGRLREARVQAGLTLQQAAEAVGTDLNSIWRYEAGRHRPSGPALHALANVYGKSVEWFFGEEEEPQGDSGRVNAPESAAQSEPDALGVIGSLAQVRQEFSTRFDRLESYVRSAVAETRAEYDAGDDMPAVHPIEVVEVAAAAGGGAEVYDETVVGRLWFRDDWLDLHAIDPTQCNVISVHGESMEPTLPHGCSILVDRSQGRRRRRDGRIFVLRTEDGLVVKRVGRDEEGNWQIESEHPAWPPVPWTDTTEIIGEVRWAARTF